MGADAEGDQAAILRLIEQETEAYFSKSYDDWVRCWTIGSYSQRWMRFSRSGTLVWSGEAFAERMRSAMERNPLPNASASTVRRENFNVHIRSGMAWVTFDQWAPSTGDAFDVPGLQHEMRVMEKHNGNWTIVFACNVQGSLDYVRSPLLRVDERGVLLWKNATAAEHLEANQALFVGAGRVRARNREADRQLQAAIRWAAGSNETLPTERLNSRSEALTIVLAGGQGERATVCWVIPESDKILIVLDDAGMTAERLAAAAAIYGISPGQLRIAAEIVAGHDLVAAADRTGISINTARTHLQRMFDKTGARSQPALVRALFSCASPPV